MKHPDALAIDRLRIETESCLRVGPAGWTHATSNLSVEIRWLAQCAAKDSPDRGGLIVDFMDRFPESILFARSNGDSIRECFDRLVAQFHGERSWRQGQDPAILEMWPAAQLITRGMRLPAGIKARWQAAGGMLFSGKMIALKSDPVWVSFNRYGQPYPPFDWQTLHELDVADVSYDGIPKALRTN
jgi:hypothetical protein